MQSRLVSLKFRMLRTNCNVILPVMQSLLRNVGKFSLGYAALRSGEHICSALTAVKFTYFAQQKI
jgi:hypothetical protein